MIGGGNIPRQRSQYVNAIEYVRNRMLKSLNLRHLPAAGQSVLTIIP